MDTLFTNNIYSEMNKVPEKFIRTFISAARKVAEQKLVVCGSGNLSWRIDDERMLITATGAWLSELTEDEIAVCGIADGASLNQKEPSIEIGFHRAIMRERREVKVVLHFQSPYATTITCSESSDRDFFVIPEIPYYIGHIGVIPYMDPGSNDLVKAVTSAIRKYNLLILKNHGQVTVGKDFKEAIQRAAFFEFASRIILHGGNKVQILSKKSVEFLNYARDSGAQQRI